MLLELKGISKIFPDRSGGVVRAVDDVSLGINKDESLAVVGESGCGKTTLARIVMGLVRPDAGEVYFQGERVWGNRPIERYFRSKARMVFQDPFSSLDPRFNVRAILAEALFLEAGMTSRAQSERMVKVLRAVSLPEDILLRHPHEFSGGERQRLAIARALMTDPEFLILDEAVSSLDVLVQKEILDCLADLQRERGLTYMFITHNIKAAHRITQKLAVMNSGKIVEYRQTRGEIHHEH